MKEYSTIGRKYKEDATGSAALAGLRPRPHKPGSIPVDKIADDSRSVNSTKWNSGREQKEAVIVMCRKYSERGSKEVIATRDANYMNAAEAGDTETAQWMV